MRDNSLTDELNTSVQDIHLCPYGLLSFSCAHIMSVFTYCSQNVPDEFNFNNVLRSFDTFI